jgi:integration host factor subunit beta
MIRSDLVRLVASKRALEIAKAELIVDEMIQAIARALCREERVELRGLGVFSVRSYRGYRGRDPRSGDAVEVKPKRLPHFKPSKAMSESINRKPAPVASSKLPSISRVDRPAALPANRRSRMVYQST